MPFSLKLPSLGKTCTAVFIITASCGVSQSADPTAEQLMRKAHDGRAVWTAFPGFSADIVATQNGVAAKGTLAVAADGKLTLKLDQTANQEWTQRTLSSFVSHRLAADDAIANVEFADQETARPLGRLLKSKDAADHSQWRVQGDVMTEVHRVMGKSRMIISVVDVNRTADGKHVPKSYNVTTWNTESGAIESSRQVFSEWKQIGGYDLPTRLLAAIAKPDGTRTVEEIRLANHQLAEGKVKVSELAPLSAPVTSFGAAIADGHLYIYGGHLGTTHKYSSDQQAKKLLRLNLAKPGQWETVAEGPGRTGLAMVSYRNQIYRIGGWEAKNAAGEKQNLHSTRDFARFDAKTGAWQALAPLPSGRSSHDAAMLGSLLYIVGGWELKGDGDGDWHDTALVCDLAHEQPEWREIAKPPFAIRALAVAAYAGKIYAIGGMDDSNDTTTAMHAYDPASNQWSKCPPMPGQNLDGFGMSAFGTSNGLFSSCRTGEVHRFDAATNAWTSLGKLNHPRMSHRLLAVDEQHLVVVGGVSRGRKVPAVEALELRLASSSQ